VRATTIARDLEIPRETVRRHLMKLTKLKLLQKDDCRKSKPQSVGHETRG
jgi:predicted ArsR family transcriptional regulator